MNLWPGCSILIICVVVALGLHGPSVDASSSPGVNSTPSPPVLFHYTSQLVTASDLTSSERSNIINLSDEPFLASKNISLLRCSLYKFTFTFHDQNQLTTETRIIRTPNADPKAQIEVTSPSGHAIEIIWTTYFPECVGHYTIAVKDPSQRGSHSHLKVTNVSSFEVTELIPCTDYLITLTTYDAGGRKRTDQSTAQERTTLANIVLEDFQFFVVSQSVILFNWTKLPEVSRCDGDYFIKLIPADETYSVVLEEHVPYSENEITMSIKACRQYNVTLNANYFDVVASLQDFKSPFANPSNIYGLTVDAQKLILMWQNPVDNPSCVAYYTVSAGGTQFRVESNQLSLNDFERCQTHSVSVQLTPESLEENLVYDPLQMDFVLDSDVLDAEISPELVLSSRDHTLTVTWSEPPLRSQCSIQYDLKWNSEAMPRLEGTIRNSYVINEIEHCQNHSLEIQRRYNHGTRITRKDVYFPGDSAQSVVNISSEYNRETEEYILSWNKPRGFRACNFSYLIETSQFTAQVDEEIFAIVWENQNINVEISIVHEFGGRSPPSGVTLNTPFPPVTNVKHKNLDDGQTTISWSKPDTAQKIDKYVVLWDNVMAEVEKTSLTATFPKCNPIELAVYVKYMGQSSVNSTYTFSYNMAPEPVVDVSHSFKNPNYILTWSPSEINVHCYTYFVITPSSSLEPVVIPGGYDYEHQFSTWVDDTDYTFEITAYYDKDLKSSPVEHTITTPGAVRDFTITANAQGTADLQWAVLYNEDHRAVDFVITLQGESHTTPQTKITLAVPFCVDLEIVVQVNYQTEVTRTATFHNQRLIKVPGPIRSLRLTPLESTILVRWKAPDEYPECAASYKVQVTGMEPQIVTSAMFEIALIEPCQLLSVRVSAQNVDRISGPETTRDITTAEGPISEVTNLSVEATEKTLKLLWEAPAKAKFCVTSYRTRVWVAGTLESIHEGTTENTFLIVEDMNACQKVEVQIVPLGQKSEEGEFVHREIEMKDRAPGQLTPLQSVDIYSRSLKLRTTLEDLHYFCPLSVLQVTCRDSEDATKIVDLELKDVVPKINTSFEIEVVDLEPYEQYICTAMLKNNYGSWSTASYDVPFTTLEDLSGPPMELQIVDWSPESFLFVWRDPLKPNGRITHYKVYVTELEPLYYVPAHCQDEVPPRVVIDATAVLKEFAAVLRPYTKYELSVRGVNGAGDGQSVTIIGVTSPSVPNPPKTLEVSSVEGNFFPNEYNGTVKISWKFPCFTQGPFELFHGTLEGTHQGAEGDTSVAFAESGQRDMYELEMTNLMASYIYEVQLTCATTEFNSTPISIHFRAPAAIPDLMSIKELVWEMTLNPSQGAVLFIRKSDFLRSGELLYYSIMISEMDCQPEPEVLWNPLDVLQNWPNENSWYDVQTDVCQRQYQATPERLSLGLDDRSADASENLEIPIGGDSCPEMKEGKRQYCNGPLKAGTKYAIVLRAFSESGYTDNHFVVLETISEIRLVLIVLSLIAVLSCAFLLGIIIVWRKRHDSSEQETHDALKKKSSCGAGEILTKNFPVHFEDLSKNNCERLNGEFHLVSSVGQGQSTECATAKENGSKNRYTNVLPYDFNRVVLEKPEEDPSGDYINASFIDGFRKARDYIASQGPKMDSSHDFWRMIIQFKVSSIVMLTSYREGDKDKCHEYFPAKVSETLQFSDITIKCQRETDFPTHKKRIFVIEKNQMSHTVKHYHFLKWPDHSACDPNDLIAFANTVSVERKNPSHPLVVHCSAGVGRTGTFIALDISLQQMKAEKKINVLETVKDLRRQRMKMVQSFSQYLLIYQCLVIIMKQYETSQSDPIWKRLSRKSNLTGGSGKGRFYNAGASMVHNFGMLPMKELASSSQEPRPPYISAAELLGNHNQSREVSEEFMRDGIPMEKYENSSCFEPDDSIT